MQILGFIRENLRWISGGFLLCFFSSFGQTFFISLFGGQIRQEYGLSNGEWGSLYMIATLASAATLPKLGKIVDQISIAKSAILIIPLLAFACGLMAISTSMILLAITLYMLRLFGQGMMTHISITAMGKWYAGNRGTSVSLAILGHQAGEAFLPILFVSVLSVIGWRMSWFYAGLFLILAALPVIYYLLRVERSPRSTDKAGKAHTGKNWTRAEVLRDPLFWVLLSGVLAPAFIGTTIFFHQAYLIELKGWSKEVFASAFVVMASMTVVFALICGQLIDRFGSLRILPFYMLPLALACILLAVLQSHMGIFLFMGLLGLSYGLSSTLFGALWPEIYGARHLGAVRSVTIACMVFASALGPGLSGILIDNNISYLSQITAMGIYCLAAGAIMLFVSRKYLSRQTT